jgi:hypothetical protein
MNIRKNLSLIQDQWWGFSLYAFGILVFLDLTKWLPLRFWGATSGEHFVDTKQILNSVECLDENSNLHSSEFCKTYVYGKTLLKIFSLLHLNFSQTGLIGFIFLGLLSAALGYVSFKSRITFSTFLVVTFSPPILLLAERANFDILMLALVVSASLLSTRGRQVFSVTLLGLASAFKFYTLPLMFIGAIYAKKRFQKLFIIGVSGLITYQIGHEISSSRKLMNPTDAVSYNNGQGFGFNIWAGYLPRFKGFLPVDNVLTGLAFSGVIWMLIAVTAFAYLHTKSYLGLNSSVSDKDLYRLFEYLLIVHVSCFLAGVSIDYRLIFISAATLSYLGATKSVDMGSSGRKLLLGLLLVSLWCSYPSDGLQIIGDISLSILTLILTFNATRYRFHVRKLENK